MICAEDEEVWGMVSFTASAWLDNAERRFLSLCGYRRSR
jgi:hypothetical protein